MRKVRRKGEVELLIEAMASNNRWYKNCKNVRKRGGLICKVCPFRKMIEDLESTQLKGERK